MSDEGRELTSADRDRLVTMLADQEIQIEKFRENVNARLAVLERARARRSTTASLLDFDFSLLLEFGLLFLLAMFVTRIVVSVLQSRKKGSAVNGDFSMSQA